MLRSILTLKYRMENALRGREEGAVMIEYVLVVGVVSIVLVLGFMTSGIIGTLNTLSTKVADALAPILPV